ncbi:MAG: hypothetical protein N4A65_05960 [Cohaesibacter sp.]|jgi:hypothetical protein|nr:hypothetical protein [Cohaesibacter sp.]
MVWVSSLKSDQTLGDRPGLRAKFYGEAWEAPYERHMIPTRPENVSRAMSRAGNGETLQREDFPEAMAVYDEKRFQCMKAVFWAAGFLAVNQDLAKILSRFDLGTGGLVPFPIYEADETSLYPAHYSFLNFGSQKDCFLPEESRNTFLQSIRRKDSRKIWSIAPEQDGDIAVSKAALDGPDLWMDPSVRRRFFMSDGLAEALIASKIKIDWRLTKCRVIDL